MKTKIFLLMGLIIVILWLCNCQQSGIMVVFPRAGNPVQITQNGKEHLFASYYGINSWSNNQKYVIILETDIKHRLPDENDPATLGLVDLDSNNKFIPLTQTRAWNFQQGCMAHWLGTSPDSLIIYNDYRDGKFISVIMNVHTKEEIKTLTHPVSSVSPDGKEAVSINFARLRLTRPDYGYGGDGQDPRQEDPFPEDDGLFLMDIETGQTKLLVSLQQISELVPPVSNGDIAWFNHTLFSRKGSKIFWLSRQIDDKVPVYGRKTTSFTVNRDGTDLQRCFPDNWEGSHFDWLNDDELMVTANYQGKQYAHVLFTIGEQNYKRLGKGLLDYDGHGTFSPNGKWMITDTYSGGGLREQKLYLMDMKTEAVLSLGRFVQPEEYTGFWRCDLHCRWSPKGNMIGFNSTHTGSRQVYIIKFDGIDLFNN